MRGVGEVPARRGLPPALRPERAGLSARAGALLLVTFAGACDGDDCEKGWHDILEDRDADPDDLGAAILSVAGPSHDDLDFAGGTLGVEPRRGVLLHFDGDRWSERDTGGPETLWWVSRTPEGTVWAAGEEGLVLRVAGDDLTRFEALADATLFGVWGAADDDVWAVGGAIGEGDRDVVLHFDGGAWTRIPTPEAYGVPLFKVWGNGSDDVLFVGGGGVILRWDGQALTAMESGTHAQLLTVHGRASDDVWAVGANSTVLHFDGTAWLPWLDANGDEILAGLTAGVFAVPGGDVCIVGDGGAKLRIRPDDTVLDESFEGTVSDLHGTWCDADGRAFAVGGNYFVTETTERTGTIAHRGCAIPARGLP